LRPHLERFLLYALERFRVAVWTSSGFLCAGEVVDRIFPSRDLLDFFCVRSVARLDRRKSTEIIKPYYRTDTLELLVSLRREGLFTEGVKLPLALAELGLIDEYEFVVQPRLAGHGPSLFAGLSKRINLKLVSRLEFGSGAVAMRYLPRRKPSSKRCPGQSGGSRSGTTLDSLAGLWLTRISTARIWTRARDCRQAA